MKLHGDDKGGKTFLLLKYVTWPNNELEIFSEFFFFQRKGAMSHLLRCCLKT